MDYQVAVFKEAGIYVTLSAHFGTLKLGPGDQEAVLSLAQRGFYAVGSGDIVSA